MTIEIRQGDVLKFTRDEEVAQPEYGIVRAIHQDVQYPHISVSMAEDENGVPSNKPIQLTKQQIRDGVATITREQYAGTIEVVGEAPEDTRWSYQELYEK